MQHTSFRFCAALCAATAFFHASLLAVEEPVYVLEEFTVSAGPAARPIDDFTTPFSALDEAAIQRSSAGTLGDLLDNQPGVSSTGFGAGASRPIIRGFDGPRVRIVESGLGSGDVSETSPDHAVSIEPLLTNRIEILRGPSTLLYGSSAIGGVVNVVGRDIPREQPDRTRSGGFETRFDSVSDAKTFLGYATLSEGSLAVTMQGLSRDAEDYQIPVEAEIGGEDGHDEEHGDDKLESSFSESDFYSVGASWFFGEHNYIGASISRYEAFYGVPGHAHAHGEEDEHGEDHEGEHEDEHGHESQHGQGEEGVAIDLERTRFDAELAVFDPFQWIEALRVRVGYTDYEHSEIEEGEAAATFVRDSWELRAEASHYEWAFFDQGVFGFQISDTDFKAAGEEIEDGMGGFAFGPPSTTRNQAFFISEHMHVDDWHYEFGARIERQTVDTSGFSDYDDIAYSLSLGTIWELDEVNSIAVSLQRTQRHPNATELFARGPHLATSQFEIGDDALEMETAYGADLSFRHRSENWEGTFSAFYTYFEDYIFAGEQAGMEIEELAVFNYTAVDATFYGFEMELDYTIYRSAETTLTLGLLADSVFAENDDDGTNLPRIPPFRLGGQAALQHGTWFASLLLRESFAQNDIAPSETETDGYTELEASLRRTFDLGNRVTMTAFIRGSNLLDEAIRYHTSAIKDDAPRPGRNFTIGARFDF